MHKLLRNIKNFFQKHIRGWSDDECYDLDYTFVKWINSRFKTYLKQASRMVDLEYHTFTYKRKKYTQKEIIERIIYLSDELLNDNKYYSYDDQEIYTMSHEILDLFKLVYWHMWW